MRVFQIIHSYRPYLAQFEQKFFIGSRSPKFEPHRQTLLKDRFYAAHILQPPAGSGAEVFCTMWDYPGLQLKWARERGWQETDPKRIFFAQIEEFKPDVFYNCSPRWFEAAEIQRLPRECVKLGWYASPELHDKDFTVYDFILSNYPEYAGMAARQGVRTQHFEPAYDPAMAEYAAVTERPVDVLFYGQYMDRYFQRRNALIDRLIAFKRKSPWKIRLALQYNETKQTILPDFLPPQRHRFLRWRNFPPERVKQNSEAPLYGRELYQAISQSKIVFNAATDFSGKYRVNMRNIEALGCGAHMISEEGIYPAGLEAGRDFTTYRGFDDFVAQAEHYLAHPEESRRIAAQGHRAVTTAFSKAGQWQRFVEIVNLARAGRGQAAEVPAPG